MQNVALITGASSGIGRELAHLHASKGGDVVLTARRGPLLEALRRELVEEYGVEVRIFEGDLSEAGAGGQLAEVIQSEGIEIDILINNAGFGGVGAFHQTPFSTYEAMIAVNITALTELTRAFLPGMIERGQGRVLLVGSVAGFIPGPWQAVYYATKAYVLSLAEALNVELQGTGVNITCLAPGPVDTGFAKAAGVADDQPYKKGAKASAVAKTGYKAMLSGKPIAVHGLFMKIVCGPLRRFLPRGTVAKLAGKSQKSALAK